ncbi:MAG: hypothetical protein PHN75_18605 [Syntrophales bacterium]|nr:hypothetical protein [Syntrophales bacterium]
MKITVRNPQKGRLETIDIEFTENNTTWFNEYRTTRDIRMITDFDGGLLISEFDYTYPLWIYDVSRVDIGYDRKKAKHLRRRYA